MLFVCLVFVLLATAVTIRAQQTCDGNNMRTLFVRQNEQHASTNDRIDNLVNSVEKMEKTIEELVEKLAKINATTTDGGWSGWSKWTECHSNCSGCLATRTRSCNSPLPSSLGRNCLGNDKEVKSCGEVQFPLTTSAFYAYLNDSKCYNTNQDFVFDVKVTDLGDNYNTVDGKFRAPKAGTYIFSVTVVSPPERYAHAQLMLNGRWKAAVASDTTNTRGAYHSGSTVAVLNLEAVDQVFVRLTVRGGGNTCVVHSGEYGRTSFSGWLLY